MPRIAPTLLAVSIAASVLTACSDGSDDRTGGVINPCPGTETETERLFLQQLSDTSVIIKWRGEATTACIGASADSLDTLVEATVTDGEHKEALFSGLTPQSMYYYSIGGASTAPADQFYITAPAAGELPQDGNTRVWLIGDSGTNSDDETNHAGEAAEVLAGMEAFVAADGEPVDVFMMLGDNAYDVGSDFNYQQAVFELYVALLKQVSVWPTIGNHEMGIGTDIPAPGLGTSADPDSYRATAEDTPSRMPYLDIFSLPSDGEAGGVPSGTEQYYSFDYGNVHLVSLDSQLSARDDNQISAMRDWLVDDLSSNDADWTIVIFHHPPYSKGANHDSDDTAKVGGFDEPQRYMREQFVPVFDAYGVDLVYNGHSHSYERSYYLHDHTGTSDTFSTAEHAELVDGNPQTPASGRGDEAYQQLSPTSGGVDDRVVYTVAGSGGKADESSGLTDPSVWLLHAAHIEQPADTVTPRRRGLGIKGSVIVDANENQLKASFIDVNGDVQDSFIINR